MTDTEIVDNGLGLRGGIEFKNITAFGMPEVMAVPTGPNAIPQVAMARDIYYERPDLSVFASVHPEWMTALAQRVGELSTLRPGWDGMRGRPIERTALVAAWRLLVSLQLLVRVPPTLVPTSAGGVVLEWHRSPVDLEIEISAKGEADVLYESEFGEGYEGPLEHWQFQLPLIVAHIA